MGEEKARKAMMDAAKLAEELRYEQEQKVHDLQVQLDDAEQNAIKWGRKMAAKLENRIKDLEAELDGEQRRLGDATKNYRKAERGIKELSFRQDEDRKNAEDMQESLERADISEQALAKFRARGRSMSAAPRDV